MKKTILSACFTLLVFYCSSQDIVSWTYDFEKTGENTGWLVMTAQMQENWVIYSQHTSDGGPLPTIFDIEESDDYTMANEVVEISEPIKLFSEMFEVDVIKFKDKAVFKKQLQNVKKGAIIKGSVSFMTCDGEKCLPPKEIRFKVKT